MHGAEDAYHMFELHTKLVHKKEISWTELESMIPFEKQIYVEMLLNIIKDENKE